MSARKTDATLKLFIALTVIVAILLLLLVFASTNSEKLSIQQQIAYRYQTLTAIAIVFLGLGVIVYAHYAAKQAQAMQKKAIAAEQNLALGIQKTKLIQDRIIAETFLGAIAQLGHEKVETCDLCLRTSCP
jgi:hypothetical protein